MSEKDPQTLSRERQERLQAAIDLQVPDKVPFMGLAGDIVPAYSGFTNYEVHYDHEKARTATLKYLTDFPSDMNTAIVAGIGNFVMGLSFADHPDLSQGLSFISGPLHDILKDKYTRFPGRELSENSTPQFIGGTFMEPEEYDQLIADPVEFSYKKILPRTIDNFKDLDSPQATATMTRAGMEMAKQGASIGILIGELMKLGYPPTAMAFGYAPLDYIGDFLRNIPNLILDLRKYPDKVKAAAEAVMEPLVKLALGAKVMGAPYALFPLHLNEYLSPKLYQEFYWPTLKESILRLREEGIKSFVFFEGRHDAHLETILELPAGWGVAYFEKTDVRKAKQVLQGHTCVAGGVEVAKVIGGTPQEIESHIKELLEEVKPGGGFILAPNVASLPRNTPLENIKAVYEAVEKYGHY